MRANEGRIFLAFFPLVVVEPWSSKSELESFTGDTSKNNHSLGIPSRSVTVAASKALFVGLDQTPKKNSTTVNYE